MASDDSAWTGFPVNSYGVLDPPRSLSPAASLVPTNVGDPLSATQNPGVGVTPVQAPATPTATSQTSKSTSPQLIAFLRQPLSRRPVDFVPSAPTHECGNPQN